MKRRLLIIIACLSITANVIFIAFVVQGPKSNTIESDYNQFPFLSPRIFTENQNDRIINFIALRTQLANYSKSIKERHGIYFEYLPTGVSIGINEKEPFVLASLLKVPVAMSVIMAEQEGKLEPDQVLTITERELSPAFGNLWKRGVNAKLTVDELIKIMITDSDNTAANTLFDALPAGAVENIFDQLDIPKELQNNVPVVTPKNYSSILRSLYLAAIIPKVESDKLLDILTQSNFSDKIAAPIPTTVKVAHKIGVYADADPAKWVYTDCGIVYVPKRPYIVCVMQQSTDARAQTVMNDVSKMIYDYVISVNHTN